jgi:hypothetical protein
MSLLVFLLVSLAAGLQVPFTKSAMKLPGAPPYSFNSYSGYATVNVSVRTRGL